MKHRKIRVDVEPLSDARWRKVDDAVLGSIDAGPSMAPPAHAKRRWLVPAIGVAAIAAGVLVYAKWPHADAVATKPVAPSHIETGASRSFVQLGFAAIDVAPESEVTTSGDEQHGVLVVLSRGSVDCEVAPRDKRPPFVVQSGDVRVTVVGTHFTVKREAGGTSVSVSHGIVDVAHDGTVTHVAAGEVWPPPAAPPPATPSAVPSSSASLASSPPKAHPPPPPPSDQSQYERAAQLEQSDPAEARAIYLKLADKGGPWASNALFAAARLASERGDAAEAQRLSKQYLDRYPNGTNAEDARRLSGSR